MCQGNVEVTAAHPFVLCDSHIDYFLLAESNEFMFTMWLSWEEDLVGMSEKSYFVR